MIRAVVSRPMRRMRSTTKADSDTISSTLPISDGWKLKNGSSIHARVPRVAPAMAEHEQQQADQQPVDRVAQLAQPRVVEPRDRVHEHEPDRRIRGLAVDVVVGLAVDVVLRRGVERDQRAGHQPERGQQQQRIEPQVPLARHERGRRLGGGLDRVAAQFDWSAPAWNSSSCKSNHSLRMRRAAGAAVSAPKPPRSIVVTTTIGFVGWST